MSRVASSLRLTNRKKQSEEFPVFQATPDSLQKTNDSCDRQMAINLRLIDPATRRIYSVDKSPSACQPYLSRCPKLLDGRAKRQFIHSSAVQSLRIRPVLSQIAPHAGATDELETQGGLGCELSFPTASSLDGKPIDVFSKEHLITLVQRFAKSNQPLPNEDAFSKTREETSQKLEQTPAAEHQVPAGCVRPAAIGFVRLQPKSILKKLGNGQSTLRSSKRPNESRDLSSPEKEKSGSAVSAGQSPTTCESTRKKVTFSKFKVVAIYPRQQSSGPVQR